MLCQLSYSRPEPFALSQPPRPVVERGGFEPPKAEPADLQSAPFDRSGTSPDPLTEASEGNRTPDPLITSQLLYHLSYAGLPKRQQRKISPPSGYIKP